MSNLKILNISLDAQIADPASRVAGRIKRYGKLVDKFKIVVPAGNTSTVSLSPVVTVHSVGGGKLRQLFGMYSTAKRLLIEDEYDVITTQDMYFSGLIGALLSVRYNVALEVQVHGLGEKPSWARQCIARFVMSRAYLVRVVSKRLVKEISSRYPRSTGNIVSLPVFVSPDTNLETESDKQTAVEEYKKQFSGRRNLLTVSRLVPIKNIEMQIVAVSRLQKRIPNIHLHIVGDGPCRVSLEQLAQKYEVSEQVTFHGWLTGYALAAMYEVCDVFMLTSNAEGWGMVVLEAAAFGMPIIMTDVGCAGEVIVDDESGIVIPVGDVDTLTSRLEVLLNDQEKMSALGKAAQTIIQNMPDQKTVDDFYIANWERAASLK